jgi:hypothetical protein
MSASQTQRITNFVHNFALKLEGLVTALADYTHDLHGLGLQNTYNAIAAEASVLREQLTRLGQATRDATLQAKIDYAQALKDAEDLFNKKLADIQAGHATQREVIVKALDGTNSKARVAADAVAAHDEAR